MVACQEGRHSDYDDQDDDDSINTEAGVEKLLINYTVLL